MLGVDDLMYLFHISALLPKFNKTDPEYTMVDKLTSVWTSFARSGYVIEIIVY